MKKNMIKMVLDIVMLGILALLFNSHVAAMAFHEIAGLSLCGLFVIHCLLNIKWIISVSKRFFSKSLAIKVRIGYIVNLLLLVTFTFALISGINTSQVLFPSLAQGGIWRGIHHFCGAISIILIGIHLGLHWSFITGMFKKVVKIKDTVTKPLSTVLLIIVLSFGVYSAATSSFTNWLTEPFVTQVKTEQHTETGSGTSDTTETASQNETASNEEKTEDGKVGGDMNDHTPKSDENKAPSPSDSEITDDATNSDETMTKHDDTTKTVETSPLNFIDTIIKFVSIMAIFAALTYYIEKLSKAKTPKS